MATTNYKDCILETLQSLRKYALEKIRTNDQAVGFYYHEEDSYLMRFANSAISLNTNERLIRLEIMAYDGRKRATYQMITHLNQLEEMKRGVDTAIELARHAQPLNYQPTIPVYPGSFSDEECYEVELAEISNEGRLAYFNQAAQGLETDQVKLSGIFSNGSTISAMIWTTSENYQYYRLSDAQITAVLAHAGQKWEVIAEASAQRKSDLDAGKLKGELATLVAQLKGETPFQISLGRYDIVFGPAAIAEMARVMGYIGFNGGLMKRGYSFLSEAQIGQKVFSEQLTLNDDPMRRETFPIRRDDYGLPRGRFPVIEQGVFKAFIWTQDDADEFNAKPTGHTVDHPSAVIAGGIQAGAASMQELAALPREKDLLYIPFLHYMNIVNPSKGVITASSRFGTRLLRKDGSVGIPFNVRMTQSLLDVFGDRVAWLASDIVAYNTSDSYGRRNPTVVIVPAFMRVNDLEISQSNASY